MKKIILSFIFLCSLISGNIGAQAADLDLTITPIRNNFNVTLNHSTTGSVTLYNNSTGSHSFIMNAEDCTTNTNNGTPLCNPINSGTLSANSLASWITFDTTGIFSIAPKGKRVITYTINTPANAIPGGHYGAIFFNIPNNHSANISMNRRIGSLLLVTVPGTITVAPEFGNFVVTGAGGAPENQGDSIGDLFSPSQTGTVLEQVAEKGKKLLMVFSDPIIQKDIIDFINPILNEPILEPGTIFNTDFVLPVKNKGTIHIIPQGRITLHEEDGTQLKNIGKELILNDFGVFLREDVVDYLTINEGRSSVLPNTDRVFTMSWQGFAHETKLPDKTIIITYESPGDYYSRLAREEQGYIKPWEKLAITHTIKKLNAKIDLNYINPITKEKITQNSEIPITIEYDSVTKKWNTGGILIFVYIGLIIWFIKRRKKSTKETGNNRTIPYMNDEIEALEIARNTIANKTKKSTPKKAIKTTTERPVSTKKSATPQKTPTKTTSIEKGVEKNGTPPAEKARPVPRKTPVKKQVTKTEV